jgi:hypothetical protein
MTGRLLCRSEDNGLNDHIEARSCRSAFGWTWPRADGRLSEINLESDGVDAPLAASMCQSGGVETPLKRRRPWIGLA